MEHAGYGPGTCPGTVGVYAGMGASGYLLHNLLPYAAPLGRAGFDVMVHDTRRRHLWALAILPCTLLLIFWGGLVTSTGSALCGRPS